MAGTNPSMHWVKGKVKAQTGRQFVLRAKYTGPIYTCYLLYSVVLFIMFHPHFLHTSMSLLKDRY